MPEKKAARVEVAGSKTSTCLFCKNPDNLLMVRCDQCLGWCHYECAGVTAAAASRGWRCKSCSGLAGNRIASRPSVSAAAQSGKPKCTTGTKRVGKVPAGNVDSTIVTSASGEKCQKQGAVRRGSVDDRAARDTVGQPEQPAAARSISFAQTGGNSRQTAKACTEVSATLPDVGSGASERAPIISDVGPSESAGAGIISSCPEASFIPRICVQRASDSLSSSSQGSKRSASSTKRAWVELQLIEEEEAILAKKQQLLLRRKQVIAQLEACEGEGARFADDDNSSVRVAEWLADVPNKCDRLLPRAESTVVVQNDHDDAKRNQTNVDQLLDQLRQLLVQPTPKVDNRNASQWLPGVLPAGETLLGDVTSTPAAGRNGGEVDHVRYLTRHELAARHGVPKELPKFTGRPEEWPLFFASFEQTTKLCGFSDDENLIRLRQALEGPARNAVKNLLLHVSCVPQIIGTLRMKFGRPELIIDVLLSQIRDMPAPKENRLETIVDFAIEVQNICATMKASGLMGHLTNPELEQELVSKLPGLLGAFWGMHKLSLTDHSLEDFSNWLFQLAQGANNVLIPSTSSKHRKRGVMNTHSTEPKAAKCAVCQGDCAEVAKCKIFGNMKRSDRWQAVFKHHLCRRCLKHHYPQPCTLKTSCSVDGCQAGHHSLLHKMSSSDAPQRVGVSCNAHCQDGNTILFRVLPVTLYGNGVQVNTFAFLDDGSSLTLIDESLAKQLNLNGTPRPLCLRWTSDAHRYEDESINLEMEISGPGFPRRLKMSDVHTVKKLGLPSQSLDANKLTRQYKHLTGLPLRSYTNATPGLLIGLNNAHLVSSLKFREGAASEPIAEKTRLGWTVKGHSCGSEVGASIFTHHVFHMCECETSANKELLEIVKKYVCFDDMGTNDAKRTVLSSEDKYAIEQLKSLTKRVGDRYETGLLFKYKDLSLPDSLPMALRRAKCLLLKMNKDSIISQYLQAKIDDYIAKGYARKLSAEEIPAEKVWYLPVFPVTNPNKPGKIRLVWDAAAKVGEVSLNMMLLKGPDLLTSLVNVIRKFRQRRIAIGGDIAEMYHQVRIRKEDQNYQRFLWYEPGQAQPSVYVMNVMTFGATCSPSCAQYVKNENAVEFSHQYPKAAQCIIENHYVDDMLDSVDTVEEAIRLATDVSYVHSKGGFHIRNWVSNSANVLDALNTTRLEAKNMDYDSVLATEKVLGMWWDTNDDCFTFRLSNRYKNNDVLTGLRCPTKREVLSLVMTIFDPLGLIAFYTMYAKIIFQETWRSGCSWDEQIHADQYSKWLNWVRWLPEVEHMRILRCYISGQYQRYPILEMHTFVDASENGYAAVSYFLIHNTNDVSCSLVGAKTRVAPLKMMSIPRLELQAAVLGARLARDILAAHSVPISKQTFWSDSRTVLAWLRSDHRKYRPFVAFRVTEILELTDVSSWRWVPTTDNVADEATKWQRSPDFSSHSRWINGPAFLKSNPKDWPKDPGCNTEPAAEELRAQYVGCHIEELALNNNIIAESERFSSWKRLLRVMTAVVHYALVWRGRSKQQPNCANHQQNIGCAERLLYQQVQRSEFSEEIALLSDQKEVSKSSAIFKLSPYLDADGLIRLGGRATLQNSSDPIILPKRQHITHLIVCDYHQRYYHGNNETVVNEIRQRFWIPSLRTVLNKVRRACQLCRNRSAQPRPPKMGRLHPTRIASFTRPFSFVGVDYFGPMVVAVRRSSEKRYGVLFTCLTTRAIHLEVAYSLSTDSCIIAIRNFMARRGVPIELWSDNGTNFKGAERELIEAMESMDRHTMIKAFTTSSTSWRFIPPASPHMGGAWERLVRSVKEVLTKILLSRKPTEELLRAALLEVEMIVNSRPLTYIPISHENDEALTPNHFLIGSSSGTKPLADAISDGITLKRNWRTAQQLADGFWQRWVREYLPIITRRSKWFDAVKPIQVDDIVYIADPENQRNCWPKGRVISVKTGGDGQVRSALIKTIAGVYERPATKIAVLDLTD